jgi:hypothetical protein
MIQVSIYLSKFSSLSAVSCGSKISLGQQLGTATTLLSSSATASDGDDGNRTARGSQRRSWMCALNRGGVAGDPVDHINLLKVSFYSQIAATPPFFSCFVCTVRFADGFVFISWVCCFCSILDEVARAESGSLRPNRLPIGSRQLADARLVSWGKHGL